MGLIFTKKLNLNLLFLLTSIGTFHPSLHAQVNVLWEARYTTPGQNVDAGKELTLDNNGNVYVTGTAYTSAANGYDIVTVKYDPLGNELWTAVYNGSASALDQGRDIAVDQNGNVYVTGSTASSGPNYDYVTIMYNASGVQQWATLYNGTANGYDEAYSLAIDTLGNCYVTGGSDATSQGSNYVTIKYNNSGVQQWATPYNGPGNSIDAATQIKLDNQFNVYVSGHSYGSGSDLDMATIKYNNSGVQQWASRYNGILNFFEYAEALYVDDLNNVYVAGSSYGGLATENDYVTIKYNAAGAQQWAIKFDGPLNDEDKAFDVLADQNQNVYVTGRSMGAGGSAENMVTIKYDGLGNLLWQDTYNGPVSGYDDAQQMRLGNSGALYVTGYSAGNGTNNDYLTLKYDTANGNILWEARFDGPASNSDQAFAMEIDAAESIYVTGTSNDPASNQDYSTIKWCQLAADAGTDTAICIGDSTQLSASATGATNYSWIPSTGLSNSTVANPIAFPTVTTSYIVSATNALGCVDVDTVVVNVNNLPSNTITASGPTTFCMGDSVTLIADTLTAYNWSTGDTTQSITVYSTGNYTLSVLDSNNCLNSAQQTITVNSLPNVTAGSDANVCSGDSIQLNASGAIIYTWNTQTTLSDSTIANPEVYPTTSTDYWVLGEDANGCKNIDTVHIAVSVSPLAVMSNSTTNDTLNLTLPNGGDIQFFGSSSVNAITYSWDFGDGIGSSNDTNAIYTYTFAGFFKVWLIVANGQCLDSTTVSITVIDPIGINEHELTEHIEIYPNPAQNYITVNFGEIQHSDATISIINNLGQEVNNWSVENESAGTITLNVNDLKTGIYYLRLKINDQLVIKQLSISH